MDGLRIRRPVTGEIIVDPSTRVGSILGTVTANKTNGSLTNAGFLKGTPWWCVISTEAAASLTGLKVSVSGSTMSWTYKTSGLSSNAVYRVVYGFF